MPDIFDTLTAGPAPRDIFDRLAPEHAADIFDRVSPDRTGPVSLFPTTNEAGKTDIFDHLAPEPSSLSGVPAPGSEDLPGYGDTQAGLIRRRFEGNAPTEIGPSIERPRTMENLAAGIGQPLMSEEERRVQWLKDQLNEGDKTTEQFVQDHPNLKYAVHGLMAPTDMPMERLSKQQSELLFGKTAGGYVQGAQNAVADFVDFSTSAPGVMTALTGGVAGAAGGAGAKGIEWAIHRATANAFAIDMATKAPDQFASVMDAIHRGDRAEATRQIMGGMASLLIIGGAAHGAVEPKPGIEPTSGEPGETSQSGKPAPVTPTPDMAAELQAAMRGNQLAPKAEPTDAELQPNVAENQPIVAENQPTVSRNKIHAAVQELIEEGKRAAAEEHPATEARSGEVEPVAGREIDQKAAEEQALAPVSLADKENAARQILLTLARTNDLGDEVGLTIDHYVENRTLTPEEGRTVEQRIKSGQVDTKLSPEEFLHLLREPEPETVRTAAAPETSTVRTATEAESSASRRTEEQIGSEMTAETGVIPARAAAAISQDLREARRQDKSIADSIAKLTAMGEDDQAGILQRRRNKIQQRLSTLEQELRDKQAALSKARLAKPRKQTQVEAGRPWDLIDEIEANHTGTISLQSARAIQEDFKPVGSARKLFSTRSGTAIDKLTDDLRRSGVLPDHTTEDDVLDGINAAGSGRKGWRQGATREQKLIAQEERQHVEFSQDIAKASQLTEPIVADDLNEGDVFTLRGAKFKVTRLEFDEHGDVSGVELDDGNKYGTQKVAGETRLRVDKDSLISRSESKEAQTGDISGRDAGAEGEPVRPGAESEPARPPESAGVPQEEKPQGPAPDKFEEGLSNIIDALAEKRRKRGLMEGITGAPVWATMDLAEGALRVIRATYQAGKNLAQSLEAAVNWLRDQKPEGFNEDEARKWTADLARNANPVVQREPVGETRPVRIEDLQRRHDEITDRLNEIQKQGGRPGGMSKDEKGERYALAKEANGIRKQLAKDPEYVADLLRKIDTATKEMLQAKSAGNGLRAREMGEEARSMMEGELAQVDPKLMNKVYRDLVARGEIMSSGLKELPEGRTIGELVRWLKSSKIDSPKLSLRDRFNLARRLSEEFTKGKDMLEHAANRVTAAWEAFKAQYKAPPIDTEFRDLVKHWIFEKQWTGLETHNWVQAIRKAVPQPTRRMAISVWMDAGGDMDLLRSQAGLVPERFRRVWEAALSLSDTEKSLARRIELDFEQKLEDGMNSGVLKKGRHDYGVPQVWVKTPEIESAWDPSAPAKQPQRARNPRAKLDPGDPFFALERTTPSYFDGIMHGGIPRSLDIGDLVGLYNWDFHGVLADRGFIKTLKDAQAPADGEHGAGDPIVRISGAARIEPRAAGQRVYFVDSTWKPKDAVTSDGRPYQEVNHWALKDWKFASVDTDGNPIIVHGEFLVHPDYARFVRNELSKSLLRDKEGDGALASVAPFTRAVLSSAAFLKASKFAAAPFHLATIAEHAAFHAVLPITRGVDLDFVRNPKLSRLVREGGMELGFGNGQEMFDDGLSSHGGIWGKVPGLGEKMRQMSDWLFKDYIPKIKAKVGLVVLDRNTQRYAGKLNEQQIYELTARQMNAAFGMQNWRLMGSNKTMMDVNRLFLTAPDFLLSRAKVVAQAFKPYNREQRYFLLAQGAVVYMAARSLNYLFDDDPHWEPENALSVIYHGRAYSARFIVNDLFNLAKDMSGGSQGAGMAFVSGRLGPLPRAAWEAVSGRDLRTGVRKEVPFDTDVKVWRAAQIIGKDLAEWLVPVGTEGLLPGAAGRGDTSLSQVGLAMLGVGSHRYTPATQMWELAADYNRASKDPSAQHYQARRDAEAHAESAYRKLDNLLDADQPERARKEYEALLAEGYKPENVAKHYSQAQHFTGGAARERGFIQSLSAGQKEIYQRAQTERRDRLLKFQTMVRSQFSPLSD